MRSYLYLEAADRGTALAMLRQLRRLPGLTALSNLRLIDCLTVDSPYSAELLSPLLAGLGGAITLDLPLTDDTRCIPMAEAPDRDAAVLLCAAGIDAAVIRQPIAVLCGLNDEQYRQVRDALAAPAPEPDPPPRRLPDNAFIGFTRTPLNELFAQAQRFGLALPEPCLAVIAEHYTALGRDPWPDELLILDEAFRQAITSPAVCAPVEFATDDPRLHAAYADLMAKRRAIFPNADAPATLGELSAIATQYLCSHTGIARPLACLAESPLDLAAAGGRCIGGFADLADETKLYLTDTPIPTSPLAADDRLLLVLPGTAETADSFPAALTRFFADPTISQQVRHSLLIRPNRLIAGLGRMLGASGLGLRLAPPADSLSLMEQLSPASSGVLIACAPEGGRTIPAALRAQGLRFVLLATVGKQPTVILDGAPERLCFPAAMLAPRPTICAEIPAPPPTPQTETAPIPALLASLSDPAFRRTLGADPLVAPLLAQAPAAITRCGGTQLCAVTVEPDEDPYAAVRDAALALIARLTAAGASPAQITLSCSAELPLTDRRANGRAIAALLGLHTVQVELGILAAPADLHDGDRLQVTIAAYAPIAAEPPHPLPVDMPLWLIAPRSDSPHLNGERALLQMAQAAHSTGHTVISTGLLAPSAAAAVSALGAGLSLTLTAPAEALNFPIPCGFLIAAPEMPVLLEAAAAIELGHTRAWDTNAVLWGDTGLPATQLFAALRGDLPAPGLGVAAIARPPRISHRCVPRPRVLIPYTHDLPLPLTAAVAAQGGEPVPCAIDLSSAAAARQSLSACADLLDSVQILLLPTSRAVTSALLCHRRVADALASLRTRDGLICAWGEAFAALLGLGYFSPDGHPIAAAPLTGERILSTVTTSAATPWIGDCPIGWRETALLTAAPLCPILPPELRRTLAAEGRIISCAAGTPDGTPAVTALTTPDGALLGLSASPTPALLGRGIAYFA